MYVKSSLPLRFGFENEVTGLDKHIIIMFLIPTPKSLSAIYVTRYIYKTYTTKKYSHATFGSAEENSLKFGQQH